jgi:hypothetical protein
MIDDMTFRNMSPSTHKVYTYAVANFSTFHGRSPDKLGIEDVREYRLHLIARGLKAFTCSCPRPLVLHKSLPRKMQSQNILSSQALSDWSRSQVH